MMICLLLVMADCNPQVNVSCKYSIVWNETLFAANLEFFTLLIDHSLDISQLNLFRSANTIQALGLLDMEGNVVDPCHGELCTAMDLCVYHICV